MKKYFILIAFLTFLAGQLFAQWQAPNRLNDLNAWPAQSGFMTWYNTTANIPNNQIYGSGIQLSVADDNRFGAQIVIPTGENTIYFRRNSAGTWDSWSKVWSSANFNPGNYLGRPVVSIGNAGNADGFVNGYTFAYAGSGTPWNGSLLSFGGFTNNYDTQISADYGPNGGGHMSFRTRNGDTQTWNGWNEFYHSGNLNRADVDFTAKTVNSTSVYNNGNLWSKEIRVAVTNPWGDYVFNKDYPLRSLENLKNYIKQNHHLPELPSAGQVEKQGINIGEINTVLVKKVEELTLYLINLKKDNEKLNERLKKLESKK
jgi:hypothetical protein